MTLKIVSLPAQHGIKFDVILQDNCVVTLTVDDTKLLQYRCSVADVVYIEVKNWLLEQGYAVDELHLQFF